MVADGSAVASGGGRQTRRGGSGGGQGGVHLSRTMDADAPSNDGVSDVGGDGSGIGSERQCLWASKQLCKTPMTDEDWNEAAMVAKEAIGGVN